MNIQEYKYVGAGSTRVVLDIGDGEVVKIPLSPVYRLSNEEENRNFNELSKDNQVYVAKNYLKEDGTLIMEKLTDLKSFKYRETETNIKKELLLMGLSKQNIEGLLRNRRYSTRLQIGKSIEGMYKIFDYEDIKSKIYSGEIKGDIFPYHGSPDLKMWDEYLKYLKSNSINWKDLYYSDWYLDKNILSKEEI